MKSNGNPDRDHLKAMRQAWPLSRGVRNAVGAGFSSREEFQGGKLDVHIVGRMSDKAAA